MKNVFNPLSENFDLAGDYLKIAAGEVFAKGEIGYLKSDGKIWKSNATDATKMPVLYMATGAIAANAVGTFLRSGTLTKATWNWTIGAKLYASSDTDGAMTSTPPAGTGKVVQIVAHALSATLVDFRPFDFLELT